jgi:hypothetical protein
VAASKASHGGYLPINGLNLYHQVYGTVIVFDQQGHGRTPDTPREMSYEQFGDDAAALLRALKVERADVMAMSHVGISGESDLLAPLVNAFLDDLTPATPNCFDAGTVLVVGQDEYPYRREGEP